MNETLKGVAHIGAELAAAKADLQREMERHRKTWRQLEQVTGLLRECLGEGSIDNVMGTDWVERVGAALSQQSEPEGTTSDKYRAELYDEVWEKSRSMGYGNVTDALVELERMKAEPAPAQDDLEAFEVEIPDISAIYDGRYLIPYRSLEAGERLMTVAQHLRIEKQLRAALTRPAQSAPQPEQSGLVESALRKAVAYLDENPFNEIASGSILHRVMGAALSTQRGES